MSVKKKPDTRVPQILTNEAYQSIKTMVATLPTLTESLLSIGADEVKFFKRLSADDRKYVSDVIQAMTDSNGKVATNENLENIKQSKKAGEQFREMMNLFTYWATIFERNAIQADSYSYQHAAVYEDDVDNAINANVKGAIEIKEQLESNRAARNAAAAATRKANAKQEAEVTKN
jgi:hypothetical protein